MKLHGLFNSLSFERRESFMCEQISQNGATPEIRSIISEANSKYNGFQMDAGDKNPNDISPVLTISNNNNIEAKPMAWGIPCLLYTSRCV